MRKALGIMLVTVGIMAVAYGAFTPSERTHEANVGPLDITVALGFAGGGLLVGRKK
jgi:hypothetical protein